MKANERQQVPHGGGYCLCTMTACWLVDRARIDTELLHRCTVAADAVVVVVVVVALRTSSQPA